MLYMEPVLMKIAMVMSLSWLLQVSSTVFCKISLMSGKLIFKTYELEY